MAITRALRARVVRDYLTRSRVASTTALFSLYLILTSRRNLGIIRPHLTLPSILFGARESSATRFPISSMLMTAHEPVPTLGLGWERCDSRWCSTGVKTPQFHAGGFVLFANLA